MTSRKAEPTLDEYFVAAHRLAVLVRRTLDQPKSVKRDDVAKALKRFERVDFKAL